MRILVVDDDNAEFIRDLLLFEQDHGVVAVTDGGAAMTHLAQERFDLVITDVMHPGPDGHMVARDALQRGMRVFLISAGRYDPCPDGTICFHKPFDLDWFYETVASISA